LSYDNNKFTFIISLFSSEALKNYKIWENNYKDRAILRKDAIKTQEQFSQIKALP